MLNKPQYIEKDGYRWNFDKGQWVTSVSREKRKYGFVFTETVSVTANQPLNGEDVKKRAAEKFYSEYDYDYSHR